MLANWCLINYSNDAEKVITNYLMYSEGTIYCIFMFFYNSKFSKWFKIPSPKGPFSKAHFLQSRTSFRRGGGGVKTACSLQLANTDPVPDCLGAHPRYCVFVRKRIRFGAFLPTTAARKRSKTWIKTEISGEKRLFETLRFLCGQVKTEDFVNDDGNCFNYYRFYLRFRTF